MKIIHQYKNIKVEKEVTEGTGLILGNDLGNYFYLTDNEETRYQGFFYADGKNYKDELIIYKTIDQINILGKGKLCAIINNFYEVTREYENGLIESYFMPRGFSSLCLEINKPMNVEIVLDMRHPYDSRTMGRFYDIEIKEDCVLIKFVKRRDWQEDGMGDKKEFSLYLAIKTDRGIYNKIGEFFSKYYAKDHKRDSFPWDRFVYKALSVEMEKAVLSVSENPKDAIREVRAVFNDFDNLRKKERENIHKKIKPKKISDKEIEMAYLCAQNSIYTMMVENNKKKGTYAGFPWFFQFWHRDEAISLLEIYKLNKDLTKSIIIAQLESIADSGQEYDSRFSPFVGEKIQSADALGWLADRTLRILHNHQMSKDFRMNVAERFEKAASKLIQNRTCNDLAINLEHETWMDSLERNGNRIEIQAVRLRIYDLLYKLTRNDQYKILEREMRSKVRKEFFIDGILADGLGDATIRPNIFIAAYLYPKILNEMEWERCFDIILPKLYLEWGGISTIDKTRNDFFACDTGEKNTSYHNGNSWYWMNNLVALVLYKINAHKYSTYINTIMEASTEEILYSGIAGHHSETSSAEKQTSSGCQAQLWSSAMYLEVFDEMLKK